MRLSKRADDPNLIAYSARGRALVLLDRGSYWQCGFSVPKETAQEMQAKGIEEFRAGVVQLAPFLDDRVTELRDWNDVKLLTVRVDRLRQWYRPGLVCIGDAAHAMSPVAGVGINLSIQDAVAEANVLAGPFARAPSGPPISRRSSAAANSLRGSRNACRRRSGNRSAEVSMSTGLGGSRGLYGCWSAPRSSADCARASSVSVFVRST